MRKIIFSLILLILIKFLIISNVEASLLPRFRSLARTARRGSYSGILVSPRLRSDRKALIVNFANLKKVKNVTYTLIYQTNGRDEGVSGSLDASSGDAVTRELLFGTCSSGVCRYHTNISNMRLEVNTELTSGKRTVKRFRVRV